MADQTQPRQCKSASFKNFSRFYKPDELDVRFLPSFL